MRYQAVMLSRKLWYVQHLRTKRFYFERYTTETDAKAVTKTLEEKPVKDEDALLRNDFVLRPHLCSTTFNYVGEVAEELSVINDEANFWYIEHEETGTFLLYKYSEFDAAEKSRQSLLKHWAEDPKAKAKTMTSGYFVSSRQFVLERPFCS